MATINVEDVETMLQDFWLSSGKTSVIDLMKKQELHFKILVDYDRSINIGTMVDLNHGRLMFYLPEKQRYRTFAINKIVSLELLDNDDKLLAKCDTSGLKVKEPEVLERLEISMDRKKD